MAAKHRSAFEDLEGVNYVNSYKGMTTIDGLHWDSKSARKGARRVAKALKKKCGI